MSRAACEEQEILRLEETSRQSECIRQRWGLVSLNAFKLIPPGMHELRAEGTSGSVCPECIQSQCGMRRSPPLCNWRWLTSPSELVNHKVLPEIEPEAIEINISRVELPDLRGVEKAEVDEMQNFVGKKSNQRWLWHAIEHHTGQVLAFVLGSGQDQVFLELKRLLEPFVLKNFSTDKLGTYERHLASEEHQVNKYKMQKIERKHLTLRITHEDKKITTQNNLFF